MITRTLFFLLSLLIFSGVSPGPTLAAVAWEFSAVDHSADTVLMEFTLDDVASFGEVYGMDLHFTFDPYAIQFSHFDFDNGLVESNWNRSKSVDNVWGEVVLALAAQGSPLADSGCVFRAYFVKQPGLVFSEYDDEWNTVWFFRLNEESIVTRVPTDVPDDSPELPESFRLDQNYPNPFNPTTHIDFYLKEKAALSLVIYNIRGQAIRSFDLSSCGPGQHRVTWDGRDNSGRAVSSGCYLYRLEGTESSRARKMLLIR